MNFDEMTTGQFAERINVHPVTVRKWDDSGKLKAHHRTESNRRVYTEEQVRAYFEKIGKASGSDMDQLVAYCKELDEISAKQQTELLTMYLSNRGIQKSVIRETEKVYRNSELKRIVTKMLNGKVNKLLIYNKQVIFDEVKDMFEQIMESKDIEYIIVENEEDL